MAALGAGRDSLRSPSTFEAVASTSENPSTAHSSYGICSQIAFHHEQSHASVVISTIPSAQMEFNFAKWTSKLPKVLFGWPHPTLDPPRETAWLDGLRGVAAFLVVMNHFSLEWLSLFADAPFGATVKTDRNPDNVNYYREGETLRAVWRLPILRIFVCSGNAQVAIFFVLSGFVLSWSPLGSLRANNHEKLADSLGSSVIRRWFRLFLPCFIVSVPYQLQSIVATYDGILPAFKSIWEFLKGLTWWANPFRTDYVLQLSAGPPSNYVMWTIPFEFCGSIFVFVTILSLSRIADFRRRILAIVAVSLCALFSLYWGYWLFGFGLALADYVRQVGGFKKLSQQTSTSSLCVWSIVLIVGLFMMGWPMDSDWYTRPGYQWMAHIPLPPGYRETIGEGRVWWGWGAILVITSCCHLSFMRRILELALIQLLGSISFMLYLIHLLVNLLISLPLRRGLYRILCGRGNDKTFGPVYETEPITNVVIYCILWSVSIPIAMSLAHFMEIYVDRPSTEFGKRVDNKIVHGFGAITALPELPLEAEEQGLLHSVQLPDDEAHEMMHMSDSGRGANSTNADRQ